MRFILFLTLTLLMTGAQAAGDFGLGFMVGQPVGVSAKKWLGADNAIDAGAGWSIGKNPNFALHSDYLWNKQDAFFFEDSKPLDLYFGLGARMNFDDEIEIGARLPVGLSFYLNERAAEVFFEVAPIMNLLPSTNLEGNVLLGLRIYF